MTLEILEDRLAPASITLTGDTSQLASAHALAVQIRVTESGANTPQALTVDWGDGSVDHLPGTATAATHTYARPGKFAVNASVTDPSGTYWTSQLMVVGANSQSILRYGGSNDFAGQWQLPTDSGGFAVGPDGNIYVSNYSAQTVSRYDGQTGQFLGVFVTAGSGGLENPSHLTFGADGSLYVSDITGNQILHYSGQTGIFLGVFAQGSAAGLNAPQGLVFGPDGDLYVANYNGNSVTRYDGQTGSFLGTFVTPGGALKGPTTLTFGPNGDLYVANFDSPGSVVRYDGQTGNFLSTFVAATSGGLKFAAGISFGPDGDLYICDAGVNDVGRYDGQTGAFLEDVVSSGYLGLAYPTTVAFAGQAFSVNVPPSGQFPVVAYANVTPPGLEDQPITLLGSFTDYNDPNPADHTFGWQVTDETGLIVAQSNQSALVFTPTHGGNYTATLTVTNGLGLIGTTKTTFSPEVVPPQLVVSGSGNVTVGVPYTIQLSATNLLGNTIDHWTINWGDGTTDTLTGNPSSATHTYTQSQLFYDVTATATDQDGTFSALPLTPDLLVSGLQGVVSENFYRLDGTTGQNRGPFEVGGPVFGFQPSGQTNPVFGPDGNLYVIADGGVVRYDGQTGRFLGYFIPPGFAAVNQGGQTSAEDLTFGPDGDLYLLAFSPLGAGFTILRFDGRTGQSLGTLNPDISQLLGGDNAPPYGMTFGPDGDIYLFSEAGFPNTMIRRFDGHTGAFLGTFVFFTSGSSLPETLAFGPDGDLYVVATDGVSTTLEHYDGQTGALVGELPLAGLRSANQMAFAPDGSLFVSGSYATGDGRPIVERVDVATGTVLGSTATDFTGTYINPYFAFLPRLSLHSVITVEPANFGGDYIDPGVYPGDVSTAGQSVYYESVVAGTYPYGQNLGVQILAQTTPGNSFTPKLSLYDQSGRVLATSAGTSPGTTQSELVYFFDGRGDGSATYATSAPFVFYVGVSAPDGSAATGSFVLSIENTPNPPPPPPASPVASQVRLDLNNDGLLDQVTLNSDGSVAIQLFQAASNPDGSGSYLPPTTVTVVWPSDEGPPLWLLMGHFLSPDRLDLALASPTRIWILPNEGNGSLDTSLPSISLGAAPFNLVPQTQVLSGDFNGDGLDDLVTLANGTITTLLNQGSGDFEIATQPLNVSNPQPHSLAVTGVSPTVGTPAEFSLPGTNPAVDAAGPDGSVWVSEYNTGKLARVSPAGFVTEIPVANPDSTSSLTHPNTPVLDSNGNVWFAYGNYIEQMAPDGTVLHQYPVTLAPGASGNYLLVLGPDGNIWITDPYQADVIAQLNPQTGQVTVFPIPLNDPNGTANIIVGPDGALWFTMTSDAAIGRITTSGVITLFATPGPANRGLTAGPDGNLWATEANGPFNQIIRITPLGDVSVFVIPTANSGAYTMTAGPDGALWFTELNVNQIGRITTDGKISEFAIPTSAITIVAGPNNLWLGESSANQIAEIFPNVQDGLKTLASQRLSLVDDLGRIYQGLGDGTFRDQVAYGANPVIEFPTNNPNFTAVSGDFNRDGRVDEALTTNLGQSKDSVIVKLGQGNGTFGQTYSYTIGQGVQDLIAADLNGDGRLDLVTANAGSHDLSVLLGYGDGRFQDAVSYDLGPNFHPVTVVAGDFNGDGIPDLIAADPNSGEYVFLRGVGDGTFAPVQMIPGHPGTTSLAAGDVDGDGRPDLVAATVDGVYVFFGNTDGTFTVASPAETSLPTGRVFDLAIADFNNDGIADIIASTSGATSGSEGFTVSLGHRDRTFMNTTVVEGYTEFVVGDFNGDGVLDVSIGGADYLNSGDGIAFTYEYTNSYAIGYLEQYLSSNGSNGPGTFIAGDFNGDGRADISVYGQVALTAAYGRLLQTPNLPSSFAGAAIVQDFTGNGITDAFVIDAAGGILLRQGTGEPGDYTAPVLLNPQTVPGSSALAHPANAITLYSSGGHWFLAATDARTSTVDLYERQVNGTWQLLPESLATGSLSDSIVSADLNGDGRTDLVVRNVADGSLSVYLANVSGGFDAPTLIAVPQEFGNLTLADVDHDGHLDLLLTDYTSGDALVLHNRGDGTFTEVGRFNAATGQFYLGYLPENQAESNVGATQVIAGPFSSGGPINLVTLDSGLNAFSVLSGYSDGNFANPVTYNLNASPTAALLTDFNGDGSTDLAVGLASNQLAIYLAGPNGFPATASLTIDLPFTPTGITQETIQGQLALVLSDANGDLLTLVRNGDGSFRTLSLVNGNEVSFVVTDLGSADGHDVISADQAGNQVKTLLRQSTPSFARGGFTQGPADGVLAPGNVTYADLNGDGIPDMIVANSGGNDVLLYLGLGGDQFVPARAFAVGTDPVAVAVADLNGDGLPDLAVANKGSNDVSLLLGQGSGASWTLTPGQRLKAGAGPIAVQLRTDTTTGLPDLWVTNGQDGTLSVLPGIGTSGKPSGFFNDAGAKVLSVPGNPVIGQSTDTGQLVTGDGRVLQYDPSNFAGTIRTVFTPTAGEEVSFLRVVDVPGLSGAVFLTAQSDGAIGELLAGPDGSYTEVQSFTDPRLTDPSSLEVVNDGGQFELYVANAGDGVPIILQVNLEPPEVTVPTERSIPFPGLVGAPEFVAPAEAREVAVQLSALPESNLALVATLLTGSGERPGAESGASGGEASLNGFGLAADQVVAVVDASAGDTAGGDGDDLADAEPSANPADVPNYLRWLLPQLKEDSRTEADAERPERLAVANAAETDGTCLLFDAAFLSEDLGPVPPTPSQVPQEFSRVDHSSPIVEIPSLTPERPTEGGVPGAEWVAGAPAESSQRSGARDTFQERDRASLIPARDGAAAPLLPGALVSTYYLARQRVEQRRRWMPLLIGREIGASPRGAG